MATINKAIDNAVRGRSKLTPEILALPGMSSAWNRHLLNNLCYGNYLEIGVWHGSTFISAVYGNEVKAFAIDNWSEFRDEANTFHDNCKRFGIEYEFFQCDAFEMDLTKLPKIDVFFYDGDHNQDKSCKALTYFYPVLADEFLFIADDYDWRGVFDGIWQGIEESKLTVIYHYKLSAKVPNDKDTWWNGLGVFKLRKNVAS